MNRYKFITEDVNEEALNPNSQGFEIRVPNDSSIAHMDPREQKFTFEFLFYSSVLDSYKPPT